MSLSNIDKKHSNELLLSLFEDQNTIEIIKANHSQYSQLKLIAHQMQQLKQQAYSIIKDAEQQNDLHNIKKTFKLVSGTNYYLYQKNNKEKYFSLISPLEWKSNKDKFINKYYYDYDKQFILN